MKMKLITLLMSFVLALTFTMGCTPTEEELQEMTDEEAVEDPIQEPPVDD